MARGIIYCMTTIVPGLVKIGKTGTDNFDQRMYGLEHNGYNNVTGLKRKFAIEVDEYDEKEALLHEIFSKSNVGNTELFAIDVDLVVQLLSSFDGKQIYPKTMTKEEVFNEATDERTVNVNSVNKYNIPDGEYYLCENNRKYGTVQATMKVLNNKFIVLKGSSCLPCDRKDMPVLRKTAKIKDNVLQEDIECNRPSTAGWIVLGNNNNGWFRWKNADGCPIDIYRVDNND